MKKLLSYTVLSVAGVLVLTGCLESLHKLYTSEDLVFKKVLVGYWDEQNGATWIFRGSQNKGYRLTYISSKGDTTKLDAHIVKLDSYHFLDMKLREQTVPGVTSLHLTPAHTFSRIQLPDSDSVVIKMFNSSWIKKQMEHGEFSLEHINYGEDKMLITAPTSRLQELAVKYAEEEDAYLNPSNLERATNQ